MNRSGLRKVKKRTKDGVLRSYWSRDPHMIRRSMAHAHILAGHGAVTGASSMLGSHIGGWAGAKVGGAVGIRGYRRDQNVAKYKQTYARGILAGKVIGALTGSLASRKLLSKSKRVQAAQAFMEKHKDKPGVWLLHGINAGAKSLAMSAVFVAPYLAVQRMERRQHQAKQDAAKTQAHRPVPQPTRGQEWGQRITIRPVRDK